MKWVTIGMIGLLTFGIAGEHTLAASFDCTKAATKIEKLICTDAQVSAADEHVAAAYRLVMDTTAEPEQLKQTQRAWMKQTRNACADAACLLAVYQTRLAELAALQPPETTQLRSTPLTESQMDAAAQFQVTANGRPRQYLKNKLTAQGEVVSDETTGLLWQMAGSPTPLTYQAAQAYIAQLNQAQFAGYQDWRLPTADELLSLVTREKQARGLYLSADFDATQTWCWSADAHTPASVWGVGFSNGRIFWSRRTDPNYVRAVRSR